MYLRSLIPNHPNHIGLTINMLPWRDINDRIRKLVEFLVRVRVLAYYTFVWPGIGLGLGFGSDKIVRVSNRRSDDD